MKKLALCVIGMVWFSAYPQVQVEWVNYPGGVAVAIDNEENVYTALWDYNPAGDITLTKRDSNGSVKWQVSYDNTNSGLHEMATWVATDNDNNILVSGTIRSGYSNPVNASSLLMKFSPACDLMWRKVYETDFDGSSTTKCLVDGQNNIYVLGFGNNGNSFAAKVKKFNAAGDVVWTYLDYAGIGKPVNFKFTPDNGIVISARAIYGSVNGYSKIDGNGNPVWSLTGVNSLTAGDVAGDEFGNSYVIHGEYVTGNAGSVIKKLSPDGSLIWEKVNPMSGFRIEVGTDNYPIISGFPSTSTPGAAFMKFDSDGNMLWQNLDADGPGLALLAHAQMKLDMYDAAYLAAGTMFQMAVCKVNSDGTTAWNVTTMGGYAYNMAFSTQLSVYFTGSATAKIVQPNLVGITSPAPAKDIIISPNPVSGDVIYPIYPDETEFPVQILIYSSDGRLVRALMQQGINEPIDVSALKNGVYFLRFSHQESATIARLVVNK